MSGGTIHPLHFCFATAQPFFELVERQFRSVFVGMPPPDFLDLFVGQPMDAFVLPGLVPGIHVFWVDV
jgi:hypothetical protein